MEQQKYYLVAAKNVKNLSAYIESTELQQCFETRRINTYPREAVPRKRFSNFVDQLTLRVYNERNVSRKSNAAAKAPLRMRIFVAPAASGSGDSSGRLKWRCSVSRKSLSSLAQGLQLSSMLQKGVWILGLWNSTPFQTKQARLKNNGFQSSPFQIFLCL